MSYKGFKSEIHDYGTQLMRSRVLNRIPRYAYNHADHLTYTASGPAHMRLMVEDLSPRAEDITCIEADEPFTVAIKLLGGLMVRQTGTVGWIKLVERPSEGHKWEGVTSLNFHVDDAETLAKRLEAGGRLDYDSSQYGIVSINVNRRIQTVNFVEQTLSEVTQEAIAEGRAVPIKFQDDPDSVSSRGQWT
jgi:hypothetical protein